MRTARNKQKEAVFGPFKNKKFNVENAKSKLRGYEHAMQQIYYDVKKYLT